MKLKLSIIFIISFITSTAFSIELDENKFCLNELPLFNREIVQRIETVYSKDKTEYIFQKTEINYYLPRICEDNPFLVLELVRYLKSMGYGVDLSQKEILICQEDPCSKLQKEVLSTFDPMYYVRAILLISFAVYLGFFFSVTFIRHKEK